MHIMFVCTGNICRSPMAEVLLRDAITRRGLSGVRISSTGTWGLDGSPATEHAEAAVGSVGVRVDEHRARTFSAALAEDADLIIAMTSVHLREIEEVAPGTAARTRLLKELVHLEPATVEGSSPEERLQSMLAAPRPTYVRAMDLDDPMGLPLAVYERCRDQIQEGVDRLLRLVFEDPSEEAPSP